MHYIYKIRNLLTNKVYVGKTTNISNRWKEHIKESMTDSCYLANAIRKYGENCFEVVEIGSAESKSEINFLEILFIEAAKARDSYFGYNLREGGEGGNHSKVSKMILSFLNLGKRPTSEVRIKISEGLKGLPPKRKGRKFGHNKAFICRNKLEDKPRIARRGIQFTSEHKLALSIAKLGKPNLSRRGKSFKKSKPSERLGKTWEEIFGVKAASERREKKKVWVNNGYLRKQITSCGLLPPGWVRGKKFSAQFA